MPADFQLFIDGAFSRPRPARRSRRSTPRPVSRSPPWPAPAGTTSTGPCRRPGRLRRRPLVGPAGAAAAVLRRPPPLKERAPELVELGAATPAARSARPGRRRRRGDVHLPDLRRVRPPPPARAPLPHHRPGLATTTCAASRSASAPASSPGTSPSDRRLEDRPGPGRRQHRGAQAGRSDPVHGASSWPGLHEADVPAGVVNVLPGPGPQAGEELATAPEVDKVAFTGSTEVGRRISGLASGTVKPVTLELGGKSANIVLDDADLDLAAAAPPAGPSSTTARCASRAAGARAGRSTTSSWRCWSTAPADHRRPGRRHGHRPRPAGLAEQVETVERYVRVGQEEGAKLVAGGERVDRRRPRGRLLLRPDDLRRGRTKATIAQEEIFGPVLSVIPFDDDEEAVAIANDSIYGLAGGVGAATRRAGGGRAHAHRHRVDQRLPPDRPGVPFGGYKQSGIGRELGVRASTRTARSSTSTSTDPAARPQPLVRHHDPPPPPAT